MNNPILKKDIENELDKLWGRLVIKKAGYRCEVCDAGKTLNPHHIVKRSNMRLRWDVRNGCCLCNKHHTIDEKQSAHLAQSWFKAWLMEHRGEDLAYLTRVKNEIKKWTFGDLFNLYARMSHASTSINYLEELDKIMRDLLL